jgi:outer membrane protein TolC
MLDRCHTIIALGLLHVVSAIAQSNGAGIKIETSLSRDSIEARLMRVALANNPAGKTAAYKAMVAKRAFRQEQRWLLETVKLTGNVNEFTLNPDNSPNSRSQFYPRYNFSVMLSLGDLIDRPAMVKTRRIESEISKLEAETEKQNLKSEVLKRYNHYLFARDRLEIQRKLEAEIGINLELARSKFNKGNETYEVLSSLIEKHYNILITVKEMEEGLAEAKLDLESIIGVNLESVLND